MKRWTQDLLDLFNISATSLNESTRVEVIQFWGASPRKLAPDSHAEVDIRLGDYTNKEDLKNKIKNLLFKAGQTTIIPHGLQLLNKKISDPAPRETYVLVLTDGVDDSTPENLGTINPRPGTLQQEADQLKGKNNVKVFAIGFGEGMDVTNLEKIASQGNVIRDWDFRTALNKTYNALIKQLCPDSSIPTLPTALGEFNWCIVKCRKIMVSK